MSSLLLKLMPDSLLHRLGRSLFNIHCFLVFNSYLKLQVKGREHLPSTPFIICSNHQSHLDAVILAYISGFGFSGSALIASKDYWYDRKLRRQLSSYFFKMIPINRKESVGKFNLTQVTGLAQDFIAGGSRCIVILPEGSRSGDCTIKPFKKGIAILAQELNLPVVPVYIHNSGRFWPKGSFFIKPGRLDVKVGKPILPDQIRKMESTDFIRDRIIELAL